MESQKKNERAVVTMTAITVIMMLTIMDDDCTNYKTENVVSFSTILFD